MERVSLKTKHSKPFVHCRTPVHPNLLANDESRVEGDRPAAPGQVLYGKIRVPLPPFASEAREGKGMEHLENHGKIDL